MESVTYRGNKINVSCTLDDEITYRITKANAAFGKLRHRLWNERGIRLETKIDMYKSVLLTTLLYVSETLQKLSFLMQSHPLGRPCIENERWHNFQNTDFW